MHVCDLARMYYEIDGYSYCVTLSGRNLLVSGDGLQCGEGVTIVLNPLMSVAW